MSMLLMPLLGWFVLSVVVLFGIGVLIELLIKKLYYKEK